MSEGDQDRPKNGQVMGPEKTQSDSQGGDNYIALISQYTERPDLLIGELEKHDPGFVKRMNEKTAEHSDRMANARFWFGGIQAYSGLAVSIIAALAVLSLFAYSVIYESAGFWLIVAMAVFYAITQGGPSGFVELCRGVAAFFRKDGNKPN